MTSGVAEPPAGVGGRLSEEWVLNTGALGCAEGEFRPSGLDTGFQQGHTIHSGDDSLGEVLGFPPLFACLGFFLQNNTEGQE